MRFHIGYVSLILILIQQPCSSRGPRPSIRKTPSNRDVGSSSRIRTSNTSSSSSSSSSCGDFLPSLPEIVWRENYPRATDVSVQIGKNWANGYKNIESMAGQKPYNFNVAIISGDMTFPEEIPSIQWKQLMNSNIKIIFAWNLNYTKVSKHLYWKGFKNNNNNTSISSKRKRRKLLINYSNDTFSSFKVRRLSDQRETIVQGIPLGLDFHTLRDKRTDRGKKWWGEYKQTSQQQYTTLCNTRKHAKSFYNRTHQYKVLAPFRTAAEPIRERFNGSHFIPTRRDVWRALSETKSIASLYNNHSRSDLWKEMTKYGFVASPVGHGLDSHRTWEAISLGCIVLVESSPLDKLFSDHELPVYSVNSLSEWSSLSEIKLKEIALKLEPFTRYQHIKHKLSLSYWFKSNDAIKNQHNLY